MTDEELDSAIREHLRAVTDAAPAPAPFPDGQLRPAAPKRATGWRPLLSAAAAAAALIASGALWLGLGSDDGRHVVAGPDDSAATGTIRVTRERVAVQVMWNLDCDTLDSGLGDPPVDIVVETWWSVEQELLRQQWRYEDGTTRDMVLVGDPANPRQRADIGRTGGPVAFGCTDGTALVPEPGDGDPFMLNPVGTGTAGHGTSERDIYGAQVAPGQWEDRLGNPAERHVAFGQGIVDGPAGTRIDATETMEWFIDPDTGQVSERRFSVVFDGLGTVSWSAVLLAAHDDEVPAEVFHPEGLGEPLTVHRDEPTVSTLLDPAERTTTTFASDSPATTTTFAFDSPATTTLMGGEPDVCDMEAFPDLSPLVPPGFTGPEPGMGGMDGVPLCARFWKGLERGVHLSQKPGMSLFPFEAEGAVGAYRWGAIEDGFAFEHTMPPVWTVYGYGLDDAAFSGLVDDVAAAFPAGR